MSRAQSLLFGVAVVFAGWNILNNGLSVRSGAIALLIIICLVINIYNNNQKRRSRKKPWRKSGKRRDSSYPCGSPAEAGEKHKNNG